jgi:hypothetical protein
MRHSAKQKTPRTDKGWTKARQVTAPISLEDLTVKEQIIDKDDADMRELSVLTDPADPESMRVKRRIKVLAHPKNVLEVL